MGKTGGRGPFPYWFNMLLVPHRGILVKWQEGGKTLQSGINQYKEDLVCVMGK